MAYGTIRPALSGFSALQTQHYTGSTSGVYHRVAKLKGQKPISVNLAEGAQGHWIGPPNAKNVLLYFHGGGYIGSATLGHLTYLFRMQTELSKQGHSIAILALRYTLAPRGTYPTQLRQATSALNYLLNFEKRDPSSILLGGDSAGGNLASVLMLHIARPHPLVPAVELSRPLRAAVLMSPWVFFDTTTPSFRRNERLDYITKTALDRASHAFIGKGNQHDSYSQPINASSEWWAEVAGKVVSEILIWGGTDELLIDGIRRYAATIIEGFAQSDNTRTDPDISGGTELRRSDKLPLAGRTDRVTFIETDRHVHVQPIMDSILLQRKKGRSTRQIEEWVSSKL